MKYLWINLTKHWHYKILVKEIEALDKLRDIPSHWFELNTIKMAILYKFVYRSYEIPIKKTIGSFSETGKQVLKFIYKYKGPRIAKTMLKENKIKRFTYPEFKIYYKATTIKTV